MEPFSDPGSDDALPKRPYQKLLEAFRQRHCVPIDISKLNPDGSIAKQDNGFTELIDHAIGHRYPTLKFLTTGRIILLEDIFESMSMSFNGRYRILRPMTSGTCIATIC